MADVVVVGGGPAGSVTALLLARAGYDVELFDRRPFPRAKACGDCISPGANPLLRRLGVWDAITQASPAKLGGWSLSYTSGASFTAGFNRYARDPDTSTALSIPRAHLDQILLDAARAAGVHVQTETRVVELIRAGARIIGVRVQGAAGEHNVSARLTIGADGLRSFVARELQASRRRARVTKFSLTAHVRGLSDARMRGSMTVQQDICLGIAPVESGEDPLFNVTVVVNNRRPGARGAPNLMRAALRDMQRADIADRISDDDDILASGPFDSPVKCTVFDGAALVGDAAGYFDPFTGQGIYQGMASAEMLAEHVINSFSGGRSIERELANYARRRRALVAPVHRLQRTIDFVCAHPAIARTAFRTLHRSPAYADALVGVTGDLARPRVLLNPMLLATLRPAFRMDSE